MNLEARLTGRAASVNERQSAVVCQFQFFFHFLDNLSANFPIKVINTSEERRTSIAVLVFPNQARHAHAMSKIITKTGKKTRMAVL
jgi:hypothetical protein